MMANLVADSGCNKGQLSLFLEEICRDFRVHDETEYKKLVDGQRQIKTHEANKEKPARPRVGADSRVCPKNEGTGLPEQSRERWHRNVSLLFFVIFAHRFATTDGTDSTDYTDFNFQFSARPYGTLS